jgi:hypothetical protein
MVKAFVRRPYTVSLPMLASRLHEHRCMKGFLWLSGARGRFSCLLATDRRNPDQFRRKVLDQAGFRPASSQIGRSLLMLKR